MGPEKGDAAVERFRAERSVEAWPEAPRDAEPVQPPPRRGAGAAHHQRALSASRRRLGAGPRAHA
jgi:hypothetical protein